MTEQHEASVPSLDEVRVAVERMVKSDVFARSPQLGAFLRFVVEAVLRGKGDRIKAYTIGIEVLRRDVKFDPQIDPIVRVEATRLRRAIERYYGGPGVDDPVIVDLPRGSYVPTFRYRDVAGAAPVSSWRDRLMALPRRALAAVAAVLICVAGVTAFVVVRHVSGPPHGPIMQRPGNGMPVLSVEAIGTVGSADGRTITATTLVERLRDAFSRFDAINIVSDAPSGGDAVDYRLLGTIEYHDDHTTTVRFRLLDTASSAVVWTRAFERQVATRDQAAAEEAIVLALAGTLLQPFGVIRSLERIKILASAGGDPRDRCVIESSESLRSFDPSQHERARACLERLTASDPSFAVGLRYLAAIHLREFLFGVGASPNDSPPLERALRVARGAVELQPENSRGYNTLASVLFARDEVAPAFAASERAIALNKYDMAVLADYGGRLISAGEIPRGLAILRRAAGASVVLPSSHHFYLFLGNYLEGDMTVAAYHASQITREEQPLGLIARALVAFASQDVDRAKLTLDALASLQPAWRDDTRGQLEKFFTSTAVIDRLARDLAAAGLGGRS